jgi:hypothetical protein
MWAVFTHVHLESCKWPTAKQQHIDVCSELRQLNSNNETFLSRVITGDLAPCDFFLFPKMKLKLKGCQFDTRGNLGQIAESAWQSDKKELPGSIPKMEETVGPVSTWGRELFRGLWWPTGLMVSFTIITALVQNVLDTTSYIHYNILMDTVHLSDTVHTQFSIYLFPLLLLLCSFVTPNTWRKFPKRSAYCRG